jgi:NAD(P)-dependent dehydrogenase (short-subunit alcohol dehydrogenase family)
MDYRDRHVVVTGGTGALGGAVVNLLVEAGAVCHVPYVDRAEADRFALRDHPRVELVADVDLIEEAAVAAFAFLCCRAAVNAMHDAGGRIVNVATRPALEWRAGSGMAAYAASKAAVAAMTVALAEEVVGSGILVNAVAPSTMDTPANRRAMPKADHAVWAKVEDVAATILFLASPENRVTRGAVVPVYGKS